MEAQLKIRSEKGKVAEKPTSINAQDGKTQPTRDERLTASRAVTVFNVVFVSDEKNVQYSFSTQVGIATVWTSEESPCGAVRAW